MIELLKKKVLDGHLISSQEALQLSRTEHKRELYEAANEIRKHFCSNTFDLCSITNAKSGKCSEDCKWCSQSRHHHTNIEEYEMVDKDQALQEALDNAEQGVLRHSLVTSGRRVSNRTLDELIPVFKEIAKKSKMKLCASMGLINEEQMLRLKNEAQVEHYHCNIETAPSFFSKLMSTHTLEEKIETIKMAQKVGLKVCSGGIMGMGETMEQRIEMAFLLRDLGVKSIPINILQPIKGTALENVPPLKEEEVLTTIAVFRFIHPDAYLRFAGGRVQIKHYQDKALKAGVNAALTGDYLTSVGSNIQEDRVDFKNAGFEIS
ncbi:biotin synthase BioB [Saccharicrinis fermentans]|uniref:Biotin synthase n=1 Tax=Saccharicrinis fermentans DSM 9555 = JCM 21142 TaxID=869213 RepID=W7Y868_9BACT|nr:biotin synthase BioB [Saccharicrinis fermentans]GAF04457.1 biotin synthase [Saccharicrinis fermentans DSM 9555 = JCM 21142]